MSISIKGCHRQPTHDELIQEAAINPTQTIKYPNIIATQLRTTPQLTRFDDELSRHEHYKFKCYEAKYTTDRGSKSIPTSRACSTTRIRTV